MFVPLCLCFCVNGCLHTKNTYRHKIHTRQNIQITHTLLTNSLPNFRRSRCFSLCPMISPIPGVFATGLDWELEAPNPIPGVPTDITIDASALFTPTSRNLEGDDLWRLSIFGSDNGRGSGPRVNENRQILDQDQASTTFTPGEPVDIDGITTEFDVGSVGCTDELTHVCVEFTRGDDPNPEYSFRTVDPLLGTEESIISCKELPCGASKFIVFYSSSSSLYSSAEN